jgi:hypothetical protein
VLLVESRSAPGILAVLLVPAALQGAVLAGGRRAGAGMHLLRHGDRIDFAGQTVWISADSQAKEVAYDPAAHGEDTYCTRTKARLKPGEPIVLCPGTPQVPCGLPYRLSAWELALQCPSCKFDPKAPAWSPPPPPHRSSLDVLLQLAHQRA